MVSSDRCFRQIKGLNEPLIDIADPLFHLGSAIDLIEHTFVQAYAIEATIDEKTLVSPLSEEEFRNETNRFWSERYEKDFTRFKERYKPVNLGLHSVGSVCNACIPKSRIFTTFKKVSDQEIRQYRNLLTHSIPPLKLKRDDVTFIPKIKYLQHYADGLWTSHVVDLNGDHFAPAHEVIGEMADKLVRATSDLWEYLLQIMDKIADSVKYEGKLEPFLIASPESGVVEPQQVEARKSRRFVESNDASDDSDNPGFYQPPTKPSGIVTW